MLELAKRLMFVSLDMNVGLNLTLTMTKDEIYTQTLKRRLLDGHLVKW